LARQRAMHAGGCTANVPACSCSAAAVLLAISQHGRAGGWARQQPTCVVRRAAATAARARGAAATQPHSVCNTVEVFAARCTHTLSCCTEKHAQRLISSQSTPRLILSARPAQPAHASSRLAPQPTRGSASNRWVVTRRGGASRSACRSDVVRCRLPSPLSPAAAALLPQSLVTPAD